MVELAVQASTSFYQTTPHFFMGDGFSNEMHSTLNSSGVAEAAAGYDLWQPRGSLQCGSQNDHTTPSRVQILPSGDMRGGWMVILSVGFRTDWDGLGTLFI
ncbi:uncharacterized protein LOC125476033 [Pyrus x bretschneideri]|uniref:uncharacterized protein LOC125476033 n=1 Tax=Pyrus x bretschneideri TaxID=225117 RepID=UPI00202E1243|nr:uncharacterized protein LOC125476033 [Pyrus x bretschneideri]